MHANRTPSSRFTGTQHLGLARAVVVVVLASLGWSNLANAQRFKSIPPQLQNAPAKKLRGTVNLSLRGGAFDATAKQGMDDYYKKFYFPKMTQYDRDSLTLLGKLREDLTKSLRNARVPQAQEYLTQLTLGITKALTRDNYHPSVRYNATLILGQLDKQYPTGGVNSSPPVVLSAVTNELLELLEAKDFNGVPVHPSVKVAALEGLERHVRFGMDAQYGERVTNAALAVLQQEAKESGVDKDVNNWMKCQAARVLARQFKDGPTQPVHAALTALISDENMGLADRCCISELLERMKYTAGAEAEAATTVVPLGNLTKAVVAEGADVAREFEELILGNNRGGRRPGGFGGGRNADDGPKLERRELLARLMQIEAGATSLANGLADDDKQKLADLAGLIKPVISQTKDSKEFDVDVIREIYKLENSVDNLVASWQPAAATPDDGLDGLE